MHALKKLKRPISFSMQVVLHLFFALILHKNKQPQSFEYISYKV